MGADYNLSGPQLGSEELRRIVDLELEMVQLRIQTAAVAKPFLMIVTNGAKEFLLTEGTHARYGARHLKRAVERLLVQPLSNLVATGQIHCGDSVRVRHSQGSPSLTFCHGNRSVGFGQPRWGVRPESSEIAVSFFCGLNPCVCITLG